VLKSTGTPGVKRIIAFNFAICPVSYNYEAFLHTMRENNVQRAFEYSLVNSSKICDE
jgi:hypothetical protein